MYGQRIKEQRKKLGLTQQQLATKLNTSRSNVANWENNQNNPSYDLLFKLSNLLGCSVTYLAGWDDELEKRPEPKYMSNYESLNSFSELDQILFSKAKDLTDEEKQTVIQVINAIHKDIDKEANNQ